jgi:hypothetical protein
MLLKKKKEKIIVAINFVKNVCYFSIITYTMIDITRKSKNKNILIVK